MENIKNATFTSVWDGGFEVETSCKVDMDTRKVFDIEVSDIDSDDLEVLDYEYVVIDGIDFDVVPKSDLSYYSEEDNVLWRD